MSMVLGFKRFIEPTIVAGEGAYLFSERGVTALRGRHVETLVPLLDGTRDRADVLNGIPGGASQEEISGLVDRLAAADLVAEYPAGIADSRALAYWEAAGVDEAWAVDRVADNRIGLMVLGAIDEALARASCRIAGLDIAADAGLSVVLCDDYLDPALAEINASHRAAGRAWLLAKPIGTRVWIGPVFEPDSGACWTCLSHRLWGNRWAEAQVQRARGETTPASRPAVGIAASVAVGLHLTMLYAAQWAANYRNPIRRDILTFDTLTMEGRRHQVRRRPQCETCGDARLTDARAWRPVELVSRPKVSCESGGHRALSPAEVFDRFRHLISPVTGLVADIQRDPRAPEFVHSYVAGENPAFRSSRPGAMRPGLRAMNGGKGITALHARVSALCEALERRSGAVHGDETRVRASYSEVRDDAVHPNACQLYDERQYRERAEWNAANAPMQYVCSPFDESVPIEWTPVWSLTHGTHRLLPTGMLYYGTPEEMRRDFVRADSNGAAAGSSLEDAVIQGSLELVERDAVALWWYNRTRQPGVDLDAFADPYVARLRDAYAGLRRDIWALDITSDLGIPVMVALSRRTDAPTDDIVFGFGAHFDPRLALHRALSEMNQFLPAALDARNGNRHSTPGPDALRWWQEATVANQPHLLPDPTIAGITPDDHPWTHRNDLLEDVQTITSLVAAHGMEMMVLDQTRCDIELPVVKVIVPGLRHFWARFAPGRLYEVPVRLGRIQAATRYEDLNPIPLFV
ncbi:MAG: TOMM precursor leader peptide-binding protein [Mycobacterium sp.]|nr:TOMM precursor leader peptide-binding protein [Mycobacterium sp.]